MQWKIVIFIAAFSVANASVIIDKLVKDEPVTQDQQAIEDYVTSDQLAQESITDVQGLNNNMIAYEDEERNTSDLDNIMNTKSCTSNVCNQRCRQLGYKYGICRNNRCVCSTGKNAEESMRDEYTKVEGLNMIAYEDEESDTSDLDNIINTKSCTSSVCNQRCRQLGYKYGICSNNRCLCYRSKNAEESMRDEYTEVEGLNMIAYEDEERDTSDLDSIINTKSCTSNVCNQRCRQLGYKYGICSNNRCLCYRSKNAEESMRDEYTKVEGLNMIAYEDEERNTSDLDTIINTKSCTSSVCNQRCRQLGYKYGICSNNRCLCYRSKNAEESMRDEYTEVEGLNMIAYEDEERDTFDLDSIINTKSCTSNVCNQRCRQLGYKYGICSNNRCLCYRSKNAEESMRNEYTKVERLNMIAYEDEERDTSDLENTMNIKSCTSNVCNQRCRQLGYKYGICSNNRCLCYRSKNAEESMRDEYTEVEGLNMIAYEDEERDTSDLENTMNIKSCTSNVCNQRCRQLGYKYGICSNNRCLCYRSKNAEESMRDEYTEVEGLNMIAYEDEERDTSDLDSIINTKSCTSNVCNQRCRQLGYKYGICSNNRCLCYRGKNAEDTVADTSDSALEVPDSRLPVCHDRACDRVCKTIGFSGGSCVNGKCKCLKKDSVNGPEKVSLQQAEYNGSDDSDMILNDDEEIELQERACNRYECNIGCIRSGNKGGRRWRKQCRCF